MMPLISIIMPVYNAEEYIEEAIKSVLDQTYSNWELILVDDCSTDNSCNVIQKYLLDARIKFFRNKINSGPALTRNLALDNANGEYITFLDSDDFWEKTKLEKQVFFMENQNISFSYGNYYLYSTDNSIKKPIITAENLTYSSLLKGNQIKMSTAMFSNKLIGQTRFLNVKHEDYLFFLDCLKRTSKSLRYSNDLDTFYRIGQISVSSNKLKSALWTWKIYYKYLNLGLVKSVYYFIFYAINGFFKYK
ncbi:glycosyltransferase family 2 protein [Actinobacillus equuli]|uniref:glycosyltransferase family 2 protein n=1 Tax=Actinobacillus equuli TaxID=718 RepID=UPI0024189575|nr:glycosyltransferase family 2 protein [Actinobacillus equuli]MDG4953473.1 glycosyltransferase [Actinobacillus equuli subsp. equuli]